MSVKEVLNAIGSFDMNLKADTPKDIITAVDMFGHIAIVPGRIDPRQYEDALLAEARYVGVLREKSIGGSNVSLGGVGMAWHLGDEGTKGSIIETPLVFTAETFSNTIRALLPTSVAEGTLFSVPALTYSATHQWQTNRDAIQYVCGYFSTSAAPVSWRVNNNATLDAGPEEDLFVTDPQCIVIRKGAGEDFAIRALPGTFESKLDTEDYTTRVVLLAEGEGTSIYLGEADKDPLQNPYKDLLGNPLVITRVVSESDTSAANADVRAQLALDSYEGTRAELTLSTKDYDVKGSFSVGDRVYVYDPDAELYDTDFEVIFRGQRLNPIVLKVTETDWPVTEAYTVAYRAADGTWYDLTDYVEFESDGDSKITVGDFSRQLTSSDTQPIGSRPSVDTSIPDAATWITPFQTTNYQDDLGFGRSRVLLSWSAPNNVDGSSILDGDHYEIQVRVDTDAIYPQTWSSISTTSWDDLNTWDQPFTPSLSEWQTYYVAWGESFYPINDLATGVGYDVRIRGVDTAGNFGAWVETTIVTTQDNIAPSTPAAPTVAGSLVAVQVTHELGKATGGTFNLEQDLHHLEIHVDYEPHFTPSDTTLKKTVIANQGMMTALIPAVETVPVEELSARYVRVIAVDHAGNKSLPSDAASATAALWDDAYISDLTVTKVTAGTISADWIVGARIKTASSGARVELNSGGFEAWNAAGTQTVDIDSATGDVSIVGQLKSGLSGKRLEINPTSTLLPELRFFANNGTDFGYINGSSAGSDVNLGMNSSSFVDSGIDKTSRAFLTTSGAQLEVVTTTGQIRSGGYAWALGSGLYAGYSASGTDGGLFYADVDTGRVGWNPNDAAGQYFAMTTGRTRHNGKWANFAAAGNTDGIFTGSLDFASPVAGTTISWGATLDSPMYPVAMIRDSPANYAYMAASPTTTGAPVTFAVTTTGASSMQFWCWRM